MSYSIDVTVPEVTKNLRQTWEQEFAKHGIKVEVDPKFDLTTWNDPVVFKVMEMPRRYAGLDIIEPVEGGFDLNVGDSFEGVVSLSARGRDLVIDQALMLIGACALAKVCQGRVVYPDSGREVDPDEEIQKVLQEIEKIALSSEQDPNDLEPFYGWEEDE